MARWYTAREADQGPSSGPDLGDIVSVEAFRRADEGFGRPSKVGPERQKGGPCGPNGPEDAASPPQGSMILKGYLCRAEKDASSSNFGNVFFGTVERAVERHACILPC